MVSSIQRYKIMLTTLLKSTTHDIIINKIEKSGKIVDQRKELNSETVFKTLINQL